MDAQLFAMKDLIAVSKQISNMQDMLLEPLDMSYKDYLKIQKNIKKINTIIEKLELQIGECSNAV